MINEFQGVSIFKKRISKKSINSNIFQKINTFQKMKNTIVALLIMTLGLVSCNQKSNEKAPETKTATEDTIEVYACPMHSEITGKKGDTCSKCGMELTEKVK